MGKKWFRLFILALALGTPILSTTACVIHVHEHNHNNNDNNNDNDNNN